MTICYNWSPSRISDEDPSEVYLPSGKPYIPFGGEFQSISPRDIAQMAAAMAVVDGASM